MNFAEGDPTGTSQNKPLNEFQDTFRKLLESSMCFHTKYFPQNRMAIAINTLFRFSYHREKVMLQCSPEYGNEKV